MAQPKIKTVLSVTIFSGRFSLLTPVIAKTAGSISYILSEYLRQTTRLQGLSPTLPCDEVDYRQRIALFCASCKTIFTSGRGKLRIRDAQKCIKVDIFGTRLGTQSLKVFGFIRLFDEVRVELVRDSSRSLRFL